MDKNAAIIAASHAILVKVDNLRQKLIDAESHGIDVDLDLAFLKEINNKYRNIAEEAGRKMKNRPKMVA